MDETFNDLGLSDKILKAIKDVGYDIPTEIQKQSIPNLLNGKDLIGNSKTGTGKTWAFAIPSIEKIDVEKSHAQVLVLCPTRELAMQINEEFKKLMKYKENIRCALLYGGEPIYKQIQVLKSKPQIIIGTPGRVMDHMSRHTLRLNEISMVVLDEADEMLSMGFIDAINIILTSCPVKRQTILFSATMPKIIMDLTKKYQRDPIIVKTQQNSLTVDAIEQIVWDVPQGYKNEILTHLFVNYKPGRAIVFVNTKAQTEKVVHILRAQGYLVEALHGDMIQKARTDVMKSFKEGIFDVLVATDVAARGIDIKDVETIINYDVPQDREYYVHRIGRTARAGKNGKAYTFAVGKKELEQMRILSRYIGAKISIETNY